MCVVCEGERERDTGSYYKIHSFLTVEYCQRLKNTFLPCYLWFFLPLHKADSESLGEKSVHILQEKGGWELLTDGAKANGWQGSDFDTWLVPLAHGQSAQQSQRPLVTPEPGE